MSIAGPHGFNPSVADSSQKRSLGQVVVTEQGVFEYAQADGAIDQGAVCKLVMTVTSGKISDLQADEVTTAESGSTGKRIGIAMAALADNEYGWFWRGNGHCEALVATGVAAGDNLTTTATAGELGAGGDAVVTLSALDANSSGSTALGTVVAYGLLGTN